MQIKTFTAKLNGVSSSLEENYKIIDAEVNSFLIMVSNENRIDIQNVIIHSVQDRVEESDVEYDFLVRVITYSWHK